MKNILLLIVFAKSCLAFDLPKSSCKANLTIDQNHYNVTKTYDVGDAYPTDAHYDSNGNLFYVLYGRNFNGYYFDIKVIKPNTTVSEKIPGLPEGKSYSIAVDKNATRVYFGTSKGIFIYDYEAHEANLISDPNLKLNNLFVDRDGNKYITDSPDGVEELYLLADNKKIRFRSFDSLNEMAVNDKNYFYFIKEEKLYVLRSNISSISYVGNLTYQGVAQISFYEDLVFIASETLSYIHENDTGPLKIVQNVPGKVTAIAFDDSGNFILGTRGYISKYEAQDGCQLVSDKKIND